MSADYSFELIPIETYAPQFDGHNKIFLDSVLHTPWQLGSSSVSSLGIVRQWFGNY